MVAVGVLQGGTAECGAPTLVICGSGCQYCDYMMTDSSGLFVIVIIIIFRYWVFC